MLWMECGSGRRGIDAGGYRRGCVRVWLSILLSGAHTRADGAHVGGVADRTVRRTGCELRVHDKPYGLAQREVCIGLVRRGEKGGVEAGERSKETCGKHALRSRAPVIVCTMGLQRLSTEQAWSLTPPRQAGRSASYSSSSFSPSSSPGTALSAARPRRTSAR
ncbi:hypothetical protein BJ912DRAFT_989077 [Pholiota molesta]|nr:hypothetical protein BJ912DRAFT_989077 [Pholiota molesta]